MNKKYLYIGAGVVGVIVLIFVWMFFTGSSSNSSTTGGSFGVGENRNVTVTQPTDTSNEPIAGQTQDTSSVTTRIFKINDGPVAGATLLEMSRPTTTVARFVMADSGHVFDLPLDSPGAIARAVSNTTIPGIANAIWGAGGAGATLQYLDTTTKTLHLGFPPATTTLTTAGPVSIKFFPDGIESIAVSPDGTSAAYVVRTGTGADGYIAKADGTNGKKVFSLPLSQINLSWPTAGTLLAASTPAAGVPGVVFSVDVKTGAVTPLIYADGLTATADPAFSRVVYQTTEAGSRSTYVRDVKSGGNSALSFDPFPEKCIWSGVSLSSLYCAAPLSYVAPNFLDLWRAGVASAADSIFLFDTTSGSTHIVSVPGGADGGEPADIASLAVSPDEHYLIYIRKSDRSLWGVRLTQ